MEDVANASVGLKFDLSLRVFSTGFSTGLWKNYLHLKCCFKYFPFKSLTGLSGAENEAETSIIIVQKQEKSTGKENKFSAA